MRRRRVVAWIAGLPVLLVGVVAGLLLGMTSCSNVERSLLFHPTHWVGHPGLTPWTLDGAVIGYARTVHAPGAVWLMLHGNAGQAADRIYALRRFPNGDSVFILEYPGYGARSGTPSRASCDGAAKEAYLLLRKTYPKTPVCILGESIGSGPASTLGALTPKPDKIVLVVPFDRLSSVARDHFPSVMVSLLLKDDWDNVAALRLYTGPIQIYGAIEDQVIPFTHAQALAAALPAAAFTPISGGHNDWSGQEAVRIVFP